MTETNAYSWNSLIEGCVEGGRTVEALRIFREMQLAGIKPDSFSLASGLYACTSLLDLRRGKQMHGFMVRNALDEHAILRPLVVDMYVKCGCVDVARKVFENAKMKDVFLHNALLLVPTLDTHWVTPLQEGVVASSYGVFANWTSW
ncbi:putative pentatricopeptide repeat-containing protein [Acorus calamus]|uniref:Pentatricopeptide repeat-containing protein n=1 Tax=Acorus calamus TaxID=4465 RepID=A0AAV9EMB3_ACOCL|nr:putative pentatricopeptide repeat-containing protein [Acorus calamus]